MMPMHPAMHAPAPPHMHPHHIQQQQMMAVAAAHAVAQQQQHHQHPMHHHAHAAHAQQMWQTRSFESGIGIYNHNATATTATTALPAATAAAAAAAAALTATATTFISNSSTETQQPQQLQQTQQQQLALPLSLPLSHQTNGNSTTTTATATAIAGMYYPSATTSSVGAAGPTTLYNYLAPYSNEHHQHQHQNQHHHLQALPLPMSITSNTATSAGPSSSSATSIASPISSSAAAPSSSSTSSSNLANVTHGLSSTNLTNLNFGSGSQPLNSPNSSINPLSSMTDLQSENIYGQTRNLNFTQVHHQHQQQLQQQTYQNNSGHGSGNYYHHQQAHYQHQHPPQETYHNRSYLHHHPHHREHHHHHRSHGSHMCQRHIQVPQARSTPGEFYYKAHDIYFNRDDLETERRQRHQSRPTRRSTTQLENSCNCVSCYTLAPLFGAPTPKRPVRSLSQQQLRQHHLLSGASKEIASQYSHSRGLVKWCSDSDVSLLDREDLTPSEETEDYRGGYEKTKSNYEYSSAFDLNNDFDMDDINLSQMDFKKQLEGPKKNQKFNEYAMKHKYRHQSPAKEQRPVKDAYVDKARLRQLRSPTPQRKPSIQINEIKSNTKSNSSSNLLQMRSKSQSTESFFEEPNEEGSLYMYGGRQRIVKAPSTTNIYDRVKSNNIDNKIGLKNSKKYNSQLNLSSIQQRQRQATPHGGDVTATKPLVPPPLWRGAMRMNLKSLISPKSNGANKQFDLNNNVITKTETVLNNFKNKNDLAKNANTKAAQETSKSKDQNKNQTKLYADSHKNEDNNGRSQQHQPSQLQPSQHQTQQQQLQQQQKHSGRASRTSSRADASDMESIYGYLKPRKPRSLSMRKIQILEY